MIYVKFHHVVAFNQDITGDRDGLRDAGAVQSACARPQATAFGEDAYLTIWEKAAALLQSIACNHAFIDGNKRTAWMAVTTFLEANGHPADDDIDVDDAIAFVLAVVTGELRDIRDIANQLVKYTLR